MRDPVKALLSCKNESRHVILNHTAILTIPLDCQLESEFFNIAASHISAEYETSTTFTIQHRHPLLIMLAPDASANSSSIRDLIKKNDDDLIGLQESNLKLSEINAILEWRVTRIEIAVAASVSGLGLILMMAICCCVILLIKNRDNLSK